MSTRGAVSLTVFSGVHGCDGCTGTLRRALGTRARCPQGSTWCRHHPRSHWPMTLPGGQWSRSLWVQEPLADASERAEPLEVILAPGSAVVPVQRRVKLGVPRPASDVPGHSPWFVGEVWALHGTVWCVLRHTRNPSDSPWDEPLTRALRSILTSTLVIQETPRETRVTRGCRGVTGRSRTGCTQGHPGESG